MEARENDLAGLHLPDWQAVLSRHYEEWTEPRLRLDTAMLGAEACTREIVKMLGAPS